MIQDITNYSGGRHPDHLFLKMHTTFEEYKRIYAMMNRFIPGAFMIVHAPVVKSDFAPVDRQSVRKRKQATVPVVSHYNWCIRIFLNPTLKRFSVYRRLLVAALINKLSR